MTALESPASGHMDRLYDQEDGDGSGAVVTTDTGPKYTKTETLARQPLVKGSSEAIRMALLTFNAVGMTFAMGIEMTYLTPYFLSLGLSKGQTALVWLASPLSGLVVQPIVGALSDGLESRWGRRRPIILAATMMASGSLLTLGFTREIISTIITDRDAAKVPGIVLAALALYTMDFSINAMMTCARSLIVDTLPAEKQQAATAWGRMGSIGQISGYAMGTIDLVKIFGTTLGDTQFKQLTIIASLGLLITSTITCWAVTERVFVPVPQQSLKLGYFQIFRQIWSTLRNLPPRIQALCWAVFWSMIGWFPFLFYNSTWIGELYYRYELTGEIKHGNDALGDMGRIGSMALTIYSIVTFASAWILPLLVKGPDDNSVLHKHHKDSNVTLWRRLPRGLLRFLERFSNMRPDLLTTWFVGNLIFAAAMLLAPLVASFRLAIALVAVCGLPWTVTMWAPSTFLGMEINKQNSSSEYSHGSYRRLSTGSNVEMGDFPSSHSNHEEGASVSSRDGGEGGELSGMYFGVFNIYMTLPQLVSSMISSIVFALLEPNKDPGTGNGGSNPKRHAVEGMEGMGPPKGPNSIAICLFIGALGSIVAAYAIRKLKFIT